MNLLARRQFLAAGASALAFPAAAQDLRTLRAIAGSKGLTVKRCRFENVNLGIFTNYSGSSNFYIADNYFIGRDDSKRRLLVSVEFTAVQRSGRLW